MKKLIAIIFIIGIFYNCSKDEIEVDPALQYMPIQLTSFGMDNHPLLSPDTKNIVFFSQRFTHNPEFSAAYPELWGMDRYGEKLRRLVKREDMPEGFEISFVRWSPNSDYITVLLCTRASSGKSELWKVALTGEKTILHSFDFAMLDLTYSPNGEKTAFSIFQEDADNNYSNWSLYSSNADFSDTVLIEKGWFQKFDWANDSKTIVYSMYDSQNENYDLWKTKADGTGKTRLTETPESENYFSCSKTEDLITYSVNDNVYISSTDKFVPKLVFEHAGYPQFIPNRKLILLYSKQSVGEKSLDESLLVDFNGNVIKKIADGQAGHVYFLESGDYFVYHVMGNIWFDYLPW